MLLLMQERNKVKMKKTVNINLRGVAFTIDEDAYDQLSQYLKKISSYFSKSEGRDEIMDDIEARIAEMFLQDLKNGKQVITAEEVQNMMNILGSPEQFADEEMIAEEEAGTGQKSAQASYATKSKRIYRDKEKNVIGGVCSGIGYYFGFDPLWLRLAFAVSFFLFGFSFWIYIILWLVIPEAKTTAEKLEMKGEPINIDNIGKAVEDEMENLKHRYNKYTKSDTHKYQRNKIESVFKRIVQFVISLIASFFKLFGRIIGGIFLLIGMILLFGLVVDRLGGFSALSFGFNNDTFHIRHLADFIFSNSQDYFIAATGLVLFIGIPALLMIFGGVKMLFGIKKPVRGLGAFFTILWVFGILIMIYSGIKLTKDFSENGEVVIETVISEITSDTLIVAVSDYQKRGYSRRKRRKRHNPSIYTKEDKTYIANVNFSVEKSDNNDVILELIQYSEGSSREDAKLRAEKIDYNFSMIDNTLEFTPYLTIDEESKFRNQAIEIILYLPEGKAVYLAEGTEDIIYDIDNATNTWDGDMVGKTWTMLEELTCVNCDPNEL